jgi:hypothetical protein
VVNEFADPMAAGWNWGHDATATRMVLLLGLVWGLQNFLHDQFQIFIFPF